MARERGEVDGGRSSPSASRTRSSRRASRSCGSWSRRRSAAGSSPTAASRRWRARCASRCPRTSSSCTRRATRCSRCSRPIYPLTRALAARLAQRRRRRHRGHLDFRKTVRASLSYGGVPAEPKFRNPHPSKPEIMVVADISGSVASFARFTLQFVYAMASQFSKVRSWVFIDGIDEVTRFFQESDDVTEAVHRVNTEADVVWVDGHSDYGHAFEVFHQRHYREITPKTSIILLGDARNNYHASRGVGRRRDAQARPPRLLARPRAARLLGHRRLDRLRVRQATATASSSAATSASSSSSSRTIAEEADPPTRTCVSWVAIRRR